MVELLFLFLFLFVANVETIAQKSSAAPLPPPEKHSRKENAWYPDDSGIIHG